MTMWRIKRLCYSSFPVLLLPVLIWVVANATQASAAVKICMISSVDLDPNPVADGGTETITGTTVQSGAADSGCVAGTADTPVNTGRITIEENMVGGIGGFGVSCSVAKACTAGKVGSVCTTNASCDTSVGLGNGTCTPASFEAVAFEDPTDGTFGTVFDSTGLGNGTCTPASFEAVAFEDPTDGTFGTVFDSTGLGGSTIGFRTHYTGTGAAGFSESKSPCTDLVINDGPSCTPGATIAATLASGDGTPTPDNSNSTPDGPWTFRLTVTACGDLTGVTAQGGGNGWADLVSGGLDPDTGSAAIRKQNKKTPVILWTIGDMTDGEVANLDVTVNGNIPKGSPCGQIRSLSGAWSALSSLDNGDHA